MEAVIMKEDCSLKGNSALTDIEREINVPTHHSTLTSPSPILYTFILVLPFPSHIFFPLLAALLYFTLLYYALLYFALLYFTQLYLTPRYFAVLKSTSLYFTLLHFYFSLLYLFFALDELFRTIYETFPIQETNVRGCGL